MDSEGLNILGFAGSLRKGSFNKILLRAAKKLAPANCKIEIFELEGIPPFNQDLEVDPPLQVKAFKENIKKADAILIATPEYNYSMPGVLKNALDWASRPYGDNVFYGKPGAIMGGSIGMLGTARAQYHLRQVCVFLNIMLLNQPEVMVPFIDKKVDEEGRIIDEATIARIKELVEALVTWTKKFI
ncbi:MAG: NAD(P)H-dependent oxidoreductase [Syntrophorhabdaceae bacterium]|nr:NAD(P)H-dependent oxidoreductase [Syntrophorhabdales bacterium]MBP9561638.1 NAD(P)H-dependent oxidoreductase [Syntrophorhabdaceae bacterium]